MRLWIVTLALVTALMVASEARADGTVSHDQLLTMVYHWSWVYGVDPGDILRLAMCESRQQAFPRDGSQGEISTFQWHPQGLWKVTPFAHLGFQAFRDPEISVRAAAWAVAHGYGSHWSCWGIRHNYAPF